MQETKFPWELWRQRLIDAGLLLLRFARNPIDGMRHPPEWDWPLMLVCQAIAAAVCGVAAGIVSKSIAGIFLGLIFSPITNALTTALITGFFYYTFTFILHKPASFQRIYMLLIFAQLPSLLIWAISPLLPPLVLLGAAATGLLLLVGFVDSLGQDRRTMVRLLAGIYAVFVIFWITNAISHRRQVEVFRDKATPESLDILEKELNN